MRTALLGTLVGATLSLASGLGIGFAQDPSEPPAPSDQPAPAPSDDPDATPQPGAPPSEDEAPNPLPGDDGVPFELPGLAPTASSATVAFGTPEPLGSVSRGQSAAATSQFGDSFDAYSGQVSFFTTDLTIPGNFPLEVAIHRSRVAGRLNYRDPQRSEFGDWAMELPRIQTVVSASKSSHYDFCGTTTTPRVSNFFGFDVEAYWSGLRLIVPGRTSGLLVNDYEARADSSRSSGDWHFGTTAHWTVRCEGGQPVAHAPNGDRYVFGKQARRSSSSLFSAARRPNTVGSETVELRREFHQFLVTEVSDVHGNWVRYQYEGDGRLKKILSSDDRVIDLQYTITSGAITETRVVSHGRTWRYALQQAVSGIDSGQWHLRRVTLPDARTWEYNNFAAMSAEQHAIPSTYYLGSSGQSFGATSCSTPNEQTFTVKNPSGASARFRTAQRKMSRSRVPHNAASDPDGLRHFGCYPEPEYAVQAIQNVQALIEKRVSGPGIVTGTWSYSYTNDEGGHGGDGSLTRWVRVVGPLGYTTQTHVHRAWGNNDGLIDRVDTFASSTSSTPIQTVKNTWYVEDSIFTGGHALLPGGNYGIHLRPRMLSKQAITRDGETYTTEYAQDHHQGNSSYGFGQPWRIRQYSTLGGGTRETRIDYQDIRNKWILRLPQRITRNGVLFEEHSYDGSAKLQWTKRFGVTIATFGYHTQAKFKGALYWVRDALGRETRNTWYYRGTPTQTNHPDGTKTYAAINSRGWITSETDARGNVTGYTYDNGGRVTRISRPGALSDTVFVYHNLGSTTAHMIVHETRGNARTETHHTAAGNVALVTNRDLSGQAQTVYQRNSYDAYGRVTRRYWPTFNDSIRNGVWVSYDVLGRVTKERENVAPNAETRYRYLSDNRIEVTDPNGFKTTTRRSGFGSPDDGNVLEIVQPAGTITSMTYDIHGNMLTSRQRGTNDGVTRDFTQRYSYDSRQRLCRHHTSEAGSTLYQYDNANQMIGVARGQSGTSGCASLPSGAKVTHVYDTMGRIDEIRYPASNTPDIEYDYDANGNLYELRRGRTRWSYRYHADGDILKEETLRMDGRTLRTDYGINSNGHMVWRNTPTGRRLNYAIDGWGRPTRISEGSQNHASAISYHATGELSTLTYGNNKRVQRYLSSRQLVQQLDHVGIYNAYYSRDKVGRLTVIDCASSCNEQDRTFSYDAQGRLERATSPAWGTATYTHDALGNLLRKQVGSRTVTLEYTNTNRLNRINDGGWRGYQYDARGNVTNDGRRGYAYDMANQPTALWSNGKAYGKGNFLYDGNYKRALATLERGSSGIESTYSAYGVSGELLHQRHEDGGVITQTDYVRVAGMEVARLKKVSGSTTVTYIHTDHLGTPIAGTNASGSIIWRSNYTPFGEVWGSSPAANDNNPGFTGHFQDEFIDLTYMEGRYYDPIIGRFLSTDGVEFAPGRPSSFNRYSYVANDPINRIDPDGEFWKALFRFVGNFLSNSSISGGSDGIDSFTAFAGGSTSPNGGYESDFENQIADAQAHAEAAASAFGPFRGHSSTPWCKDAPCSADLSRTIEAAARAIIAGERYSACCVGRRKHGVVISNFIGRSLTGRPRLRPVWGFRGTAHNPLGKSHTCNCIPDGSRIWLFGSSNGTFYDRPPGRYVQKARELRQQGIYSIWVRHRAGTAGYSLVGIE